MRSIDSKDDDNSNFDDNSDSEEQIDLLNNLPPIEKITLESNYIKHFSLILILFDYFLVFLKYLLSL